jgi:competence protein ComEC
VLWQICFLVFACGLFAHEHFLPACLSCGIVVFLAKDRLSFGATAFLFPLCFALGIGYTALRMPTAPADLESWPARGHKVEATGVVDEVTARPAQKLRVLLKDVQYTGKESGKGTLPGFLAWTLDKPLQMPEPGQSISVETRIKGIRGFKNPGTWEYQKYWAQRGAYYRAYTRASDASLSFDPSPENPFHTWRAKLRSALTADQEMSDGRALLTALLLGERFHLSPSLVDLFREGALAHSLALSGTHLGCVAVLGIIPAWLIGMGWPGIYLHIPRKKLAVLLAAVPMLFYLWLGGATPSLLRAFVMFASWGILLCLGRARTLLDGLFLAAACILLFSPLSIYDLRFQLSVTAVAGIIVALPYIRFVLRRMGLGQEPSHSGFSLRNLIIKLAAAPIVVFLIGAVANIALLPITAQTFGQVPTNILANVLWLPLLSLVVLPLGLFGLVLSLMPGCENLGLQLLNMDAAMLDSAVAGLRHMQEAGWFHAPAVYRPLWPQLIGWYLVLAVLLGVVHRNNRAGILTAMLGVTLLAAPFAHGLYEASQDRLRIIFPDVGQGLCVIIEAPGGKRLLYDGGGVTSDTFDIGRAVVGPLLTHGKMPRVEHVVMSHPDKDHYGGLLHILESFRVGTFHHPGRLPEGVDRLRLDKAIGKGAFAVRTPLAGEVIDLSSDVRVQVLHPPKDHEYKKDNNISLVLRVLWHDRPVALLTGDLEKKALRRLIKSGHDLRAEVLALPHHGAASGRLPKLYDIVEPELAVASAGWGNRWSFPNVKVRAALEERSIPLAVTGEDGAVTIEWKGKDGEMQVEQYLRK